MNACYTLKGATLFFGSVEQLKVKIESSLCDFTGIPTQYREQNGSSNRNEFI